MEFKKRTLKAIADMICGNYKLDKSYFVYRSSSFLTRFFQDCDTDYEHDGTTRNRWVEGVLEKILAEPQTNAQRPPGTFLRVIKILMDPADAVNEGSDRPGAFALLNANLAREGFEAFYGEDKQCQLRHIATNSVVSNVANPHRPFSQAEMKRREQLISYLETASEDDLINTVLLPLFRQLGFLRITASGHKDKSLEYGKDVWMKYILPTEHVLYFGIQVKKGKIDASGIAKKDAANVGVIYDQSLMMLGHEIFDPEIGKRVLVDHAFIVAGGEITKAARNWLGGKLDASKRSQILFMDREDILNLYIVTNLPIPKRCIMETAPNLNDDSPF